MNAEALTAKVTIDNYEDLISNSQQPILLDFWADWCGPCKTIAPLLDQLAKSYKGRVRVGKVNVDEEPVLANKHRIRSIPTLLIFKNGQVVDEINGLAPEAIIQEKLERWID